MHTFCPSLLSFLPAFHLVFFCLPPFFLLPCLSMSCLNFQSTKSIPQLSLLIYFFLYISYYYHFIIFSFHQLIHLTLHIHHSHSFSTCTPSLRPFPFFFLFSPFIYSIHPTIPAFIYPSFLTIPWRYRAKSLESGRK